MVRSRTAMIGSLLSNAVAMPSVMSSVGYSYQCRVTGEEQANALLHTLVSQGITLIAFELREPSLHEIFVEKVGDVHEES